MLAALCPGLLAVGVVGVVDRSRNALCTRCIRKMQSCRIEHTMNTAHGNASIVHGMQDRTGPVVTHRLRTCDTYLSATQVQMYGIALSTVYGIDRSALSDTMMIVRGLRFR